jgi:hypothetical protein
MYLYYRIRQCTICAGRLVAKVKDFYGQLRRKTCELLGYPEGYCFNWFCAAYKENTGGQNSHRDIGYHMRVCHGATQNGKPRYVRLARQRPSRGRGRGQGGCVLAMIGSG